MRKKLLLLPVGVSLVLAIVALSFMPAFAGEKEPVKSPGVLLHHVQLFDPLLLFRPDFLRKNKKALIQAPGHIEPLVLPRSKAGGYKNPSFLIQGMFVFSQKHRTPPYSPLYTTLHP